MNKKNLFFLVMLTMMALGFGLVSQNVSAQPPELLKIDVCHATKAEANPYTKVNVNINSVEDAQNVGGHGDHEDDIWAPYTYGGVNYPGQGDQSIAENGCEVPNEEPPKSNASASVSVLECEGGDSSSPVMISSSGAVLTITYPDGVTTFQHTGSDTYKDLPVGAYTIKYDFDQDFEDPGNLPGGFTISACELEEKEEPKEEPKEEAPSVSASTVDPQPDQPAGGSGPNMTSLLVSALVGLSGLGTAATLIVKKVKLS